MINLRRLGVVHPSIEIANGVVRGRINGEALLAHVEMESVRGAGLQLTRVVFDKLPASFAALAGSTSSWLSWCNNRVGEEIEGALNLNTLAGGNYVVERRNEYSDGSFIEMRYDVRRVGENEVEMEAEWEGTYGLPTDIVGIYPMPIVEELESVGPGLIQGFYRVALVDSAGRRFEVHTPSSYRFDPLPDRPAVLPFEQRRVTTITFSWPRPGRELWLEGQTVLAPARLIPDELSLAAMAVAGDAEEEA